MKQTFKISSHDERSVTPKICLASGSAIILLALLRFCTVSWATPDFEASAASSTNVQLKDFKKSKEIL